MKKLKPQKIDWAQIERFLQNAEKKLASAHKILAFDEEACLQQAYEAMLKASLGFMFSHGFRARSQPGHHIAIIEFVRGRIDKRYGGLLTVFDRLRRKRNIALYDDTGFVSRHDVLAWLKADGRGYETKANWLLRHAMVQHTGEKGPGKRERFRRKPRQQKGKAR